MRAAIIGSGIGGLASAARLVSKGFEVDVYESNSELGGKLASFTNKGYRFDKGPSLFTLPELLDDIFKLFDKNPRDYIKLHQLETACNYFDGNQRISASTNLEKFSEAVSNLESAHQDLSKQVKNYIKKSRDLYDLSAPMFVTDKQSLASINGIKLTLTALKSGGFKSLNDFNELQLKHPLLVKIFNRFATYNGSSPYETRGLLSCISALEHSLGAFFPVGGMIEIPNSVVKLGKEIGVNFHVNSKVSRLEKLDHYWLVKTPNSEKKYDVVVYNGDIYQLDKILDLPLVNQPLTKNLSTSAVVFYWGVNKVFENLDVHNIIFSEDYQKEFHQLGQQVLPDDPTIYIHVSSKLEPSDAPANCENWFVMVNVPAKEISENEIQKLKQKVISKLNKQFGIELNKLIEVEDVFTPQLIEEKTSSFKGALYGLNSNTIKNILNRPKNKSKYKGLYFAGGTVFPGGGVPLCLSSAKIAVQEIVKDYNL